ncbi:iron (metal) dependent repressor, DtxR family [Chitinophaga terrae (ex Kim and Jung 2007)]|jgi:DtxR family Mn-dependent transcriptional regulator|uniref:Transcriptional regulator MntR n=1 Tax=Chitinophaga terrae (ex Kim and Jung 2007) TaxID=408074 RepID=A0A1H4E4K5_9BACT|nr:metal-dependent transcriptional regulator [Chitinophaga terrae (ex Kim and Jung 2007)]MDQ0108290.1 DtxR family Mn-dependent transcriptional regulator [Chitinophaga terrae (ex Kim and Jung 2007)]GEP91406.1 iron-dependent repressor [Chitinophaga terrae (ex Kim and Jung 2007)]SEA79846.1 iron (metal) dependent repressor, DtxR family [Chitinophaga terrae (ex Kim and Jung 2007)]
MNLSIAEENYIKSIYKLQEGDTVVTTNALAYELETKPASVTDMAKKLKEKLLIDYEKYKGFTLTTEGRKMALQIVRRHRLWECFLVDKLSFSWEEVHELAEELEHVRSEKLTSRLSEYLGNPLFDPHGDPIPDANGKLTKPRPQTSLDQSTARKVVVTAVTDQSTALLAFLNAKHIKLGTQLEVIEHYEYDNSIEIKIKQQPPITISEQVAKNIMVRPV